MSFGFEVRGPDGSVQIDSSTWGWQIAYTFSVSIPYFRTTYNGPSGSVVFDGTGGRPEISADADIYVTSFGGNYEGGIQNLNLSVSNHNGYKKLSYAVYPFRRYYSEIDETWKSFYTTCPYYDGSHIQDEGAAVQIVYVFTR